jgi:hypothetical protein
VQNIASSEAYQDYSGIDCMIIGIHELAKLEQVSNSLI